jgi:phosphoglycerol transferase MdoB-like AlkP superfamily enzyme
MLPITTVYLPMNTLPLFFPAWLIPVIVLAVIWSLFWKGLALWHAGRNSQPIWFVVLLISSTLGVLDILYLVFFQIKPKEKRARRR